MSNRLFVGTRKGAFRLDRGETGWQITERGFLGDNVSLVMHDSRDGAVYAALDHAHFGVKMHRSDDDGVTWKPIATPAYPPKPEDSEDKTAWKLKLVWALAPGGPDQEGLVWCGSLPGGLFRSRDRGESWELVRSLWEHSDRQKWFGGGADVPGIHSINVDPRDSNRVLASVSCGGAWLTEDCGETWACRADGMWAAYMPPEHKHDPIIQDPHCVVQCRAQPDVYWAQHHNGVFRSTDGAASWQEIDNVPPSTFGFAVAVHPDDANTAWFVPAIKDEKRIPVDGNVVVARTRDGGETFELLRDGLPQTDAYDITFRHGLDVDSTGARIAFGSTTGSLWVSEDQGDHWTTISTHLPPVYSVTFA
jgi:hypothetical protein